MGFLKYSFQHCFICRPSDSAVNAGIEKFKNLNFRVNTHKMSLTAHIFLAKENFAFTKIKKFRHVSTFVVVQLMVFFTLTKLMFFFALLPLRKLFSFHRMKALGKSLLMLDENLWRLLLHKALLVTVQKDPV